MTPGSGVGLPEPLALTPAGAHTPCSSLWTFTQTLGQMVLGGLLQGTMELPARAPRGPWRGAGEGGAFRTRLQEEGCGGDAGTETAGQAAGVAGARPASSSHPKMGHKSPFPTEQVMALKWWFPAFALSWHTQTDY